VPQVLIKRKALILPSQFQFPFLWVTELKLYLFTEYQPKVLITLFIKDLIASE